MQQASNGDDQDREIEIQRRIVDPEVRNWMSGVVFAFMRNPYDRSCSSIKTIRATTSALNKTILCGSRSDSIVRRQLSVDKLLNIVLKPIPTITAFFDKVMVMAEDEKVRQNRLALVGQVASLSIGVADLSKLEGF